MKAFAPESGIAVLALAVLAALLVGLAFASGSCW